MIPFLTDVPLRRYTTLRAGGPAEFFAEARDVDSLVNILAEAHWTDQRVTILGGGSNMLPSDMGVPGLVLRNLAREISIDSTSGEVEVATGIAFQDLFLKTVQAGLRGLEYAVGIPGSLGGALVSNAGAYRSQVSEFITQMEVVENGNRKWVEPHWMQFSYRDSILRRPNPPHAGVVRVRMKLPRAESVKRSYDEAREYQRQRISKQPPSPSAGSFFKNVINADLAQKLPGLPEPLVEKGIVPAGYLIEAVGLKGFRLDGAMFGCRHANFILNIGKATSSNIRQLAEYGSRTVRREFGVELEEEVLYIGDWSSYSSVPE